MSNDQSVRDDSTALSHHAASTSPHSLTGAGGREDVRLFDLAENGPGIECALTRTQAEALMSSTLVTVTPTVDGGHWTIGPARFVGAARVTGVDIRIRPKLPIRRLMFLLGYAYDLSAWRDETVDVAEDSELLPTVATAFARQAERAVEQGLLQGYRVTQESAPVLRGRIRTEDQLRRRFGLPLPLKIRYDDYTVDIPENQILRTAGERLLRVPRVPQRTRRSLPRLVRSMSDVRTLPRAALVPVWQTSRLNARYQPALRLGELVLRSGSIEHDRGRPTVDGFMLNMATVFEQLLTVAHREAMPPGTGRFLAQPCYHRYGEARITLRPDIVWQAGGSGPPLAVVDAKYKAEKPSGYPNADVYQMLAYCLRLGLPEGHLVYAEGEASPGRHHIVGSDVTIVRHALDLSTGTTDLLQQVQDLAPVLTAP